MVDSVCMALQVHTLLKNASIFIFTKSSILFLKLTDCTKGDEENLYIYDVSFYISPCEPVLDLLGEPVTGTPSISFSSSIIAHIGSMSIDPKMAKPP